MGGSYGSGARRAGQGDQLPEQGRGLRDGPCEHPGVRMIVAENSELAELWDESEDGEAWRAAVQELRDRGVG